ncbi:hypothetical protein Aduo_010435 [Ancylostoma duodenale]
MKWLAIALCVALFCVGLIESAPADQADAAKKAMKINRIGRLNFGKKFDRFGGPAKIVSPFIFSTPQLSLSYLRTFMRNS